MAKSRDQYHRMQRFVRGFSNHRRIEILLYLNEHKGASVVDVAEALGVKLNTISAHVIRLANANLVWKHSDGVAAKCELSREGESVVKFLKLFL
ncbi:MAG: hypothetical protein COU09_02210 [Candidatus Harrisonbacteria bacterium CG10_big_fil_rev_8_21_14_0_10_44_23]|uniref:HTH arsR-type domain-containing protein n=1 Tax=Candidatus Harrisonbacteria bacterium CG10_big_fil_rev_8_21_14_0_10_44_23 TaxID=1974585 RepID=A0A2H0URQ7_9BACT|nr:MAG: hypothetical protein COU09_02210 [Candidatus Harrisonbacteria bacterium CG10_big_fil_rev_8_21_14_0_10_44_23]